MGKWEVLGHVLVTKVTYTILRRQTQTCCVLEKKSDKKR